MGKYITELAEQLGSQVAGGIVGTGMGLLLEGHNDRRQLRQQGKLQELQIAGNKQMIDYQKMKDLEMWKETSYPGQMKMMKEAGINPGLMYGMGGGGGTTIGGSSNVTSGNAPTGGREVLDSVGMGLQLQLLKAQKENIEADTKDKLASIPVKSEEAITKGLANKWEAWKQSHNEEGYQIIDGQAYDTKGNQIKGKTNITWKESENKMAWDRTLNEINGIIKDNAIKDEEVTRVKAAVAEIGQKIEMLKSQKLNIEEITKNLTKEGIIKDFEIEMNKVGLTHSSIEQILKVLLYKL